MTCGIYQSFRVVRDIESELDRLIEDLPSAFDEMEIEYDDYDEGPKSWAPEASTLLFNIAKARPRRRRPGELALHFDFVRTDVPGSTWPHAQQALAVVAYALDRDDGWTYDFLRVTGDGRPGFDAEGSLTPFAGGRLLAIPSDPPGAWCEAEWLYAVPLLSLHSPEALAVEVARPVTAMLKKGMDPDAALSGTSAIVWGQQA